jgi:hypothetical protein
MNVRCTPKPIVNADKACLLKSVAINSLYGTNIYAIIPMADHIHSIFSGRDGDAARGEDWLSA